MVLYLSMKSIGNWKRSTVLSKSERNNLPDYVERSYCVSVNVVDVHDWKENHAGKHEIVLYRATLLTCYGLFVETLLLFTTALICLHRLEITHTPHFGFEVHISPKPFEQ